MLALITVDKTRYHNSFVRVFPPHVADEIKTIDLKYQVSIAGLSDKGFYLHSGNSVAEISYDMLDTCQVPIENPYGYEVMIDSPFFIIQSGTSAFLQRGATGDWQNDTTFEKITGFTAVQMLSKDGFVLRSIDNGLRKNVLIKTGHPTLRKDILKTQVDGILCTDGFLMYNRRLNLIIYVYRYRNEVICMDTTLNIVRTFKTIDTTSVAKIEVAEAAGQITMSKPPLVVNRSACVDDHNLFVNSNLVARNEETEHVKHKNVIDVYNIYDGSYRFSFYISGRGKDKMEMFRVKDNILIAKFPRYISKHHLAPSYFK